MSCNSLFLVLLLATCSKVGCGQDNMSTRRVLIYETSSSSLSYYRTHIYLDHFIKSKDKGEKLSFENGSKVIEFAPEVRTKIAEREDRVNIIQADNTLFSSVALIRRITPKHFSRKAKPRVLVIGDSVTSGYGSNSNKSKSWHPNQYWAYAKMYFEMDKIDGGDKDDDFNALFLGSKSKGDFTIEYGGISRLVRARAEGYGGASLEQLFEPIFGNENSPNPFYDSEKEAFSMLSYLARFRTMDDQGVKLNSFSSNPAGEIVTGSDGKDYVIGNDITSQSLLENIDVCTPSVVVVNLCHNTILENYKKSIGQVVGTLRKELPDAKIVIMTIDEAGTLFPEVYPDFVGEQIVYKGLHDKNLAIYDYVTENVENEKEGVYVFAAQYVMPTTEGFPTIENNGINEQNLNVKGPHYHPNNKAHEAWGYALYSLIKYIISLDKR